MSHAWEPIQVGKPYAYWAAGQQRWVQVTVKAISHGVATVTTERGKKVEVEACVLNPPSRLDENDEETK